MSEKQALVTERGVAARSARADRATRLSATYQDARHWVSEQKSIERQYRLEGSYVVRATHAQAEKRLSARFGDNVTSRSANTPWYRGKSLIEHLETVEVGGKLDRAPFRFPVQWVNRPDQSFRGYAGTVAAGRVRTGERLAVAGTVVAVDGSTVPVAAESLCVHGDTMAAVEVARRVRAALTGAGVSLAPFA